MHLYDPSCGLFGTNGLVGGGLPSAVGAGLSARVRGTDDIGVAFFGDGATNHAAFHESLNFAGVQHAPVVFVCENNGYGMGTSMARSSALTDYHVRGQYIPGLRVDGQDVLAVKAATAFDNAAYSSTGLKAASGPVAATPSTWLATDSAGKAFSITIATAALTAGKIAVAADLRRVA